MHCDLGWRQREDQPPATGVDRLVLKHVAEKCSVSLGVLAVDDDVSAVNHAPSVPAHETPPNPPLQRPKGSVAMLLLPFAAERQYRWAAKGSCGELLHPPARLSRPYSSPWPVAMLHVRYSRATESPMSFRSEVTILKWPRRFDRHRRRSTSSSPA